MIKRFIDYGKDRINQGADREDSLRYQRFLFPA